jgi:hypothetical protein
VGQHMDFGVMPIDQFTVEPNFIAVGQGHAAGFLLIK